jgi:hypothetical protein
MSVSTTKKDIFCEVMEAIRIRTDERGEAAVSLDRG